MLCIHVNDSKHLFTFAQRLVFGIISSIEWHQACNFYSKLTKTLGARPLNNELTKEQSNMVDPEQVPEGITPQTYFQRYLRSPATASSTQKKRFEKLTRRLFL